MKRIRDLARLLRKKESQGADVKTVNVLRMRLEDTRLEHESKQQQEKEKKNVIKYRLVRFVERKKLVRRIRQVKAKLADGSVSDEADSSSSLQSELDSLMADLEYVMYFPKNMNYVGLFVDNERRGDTALDDTSRQNKAKARALAKVVRDDDVTNGREDRVMTALACEVADEEVQREVRAAKPASQMKDPSFVTPLLGSESDNAGERRRDKKKDKQRKGGRSEAKENSTTSSDGIAPIEGGASDSGNKRKATIEGPAAPTSTAPSAPSSSTAKRGVYGKFDLSNANKKKKVDDEIVEEDEKQADCAGENGAGENDADAYDADPFFAEEDHGQAPATNDDDNGQGSDGFRRNGKGAYNGWTKGHQRDDAAWGYNRGGRFKGGRGGGGDRQASSYSNGGGNKSAGRVKQEERLRRWQGGRGGGRGRGGRGSGRVGQRRNNF